MERRKMKGKTLMVLNFNNVILLIGNSSLSYSAMNGEDYISLKAVEPF